MWSGERAVRHTSTSISHSCSSVFSPIVKEPMQMNANLIQGNPHHKDGIAVWRLLLIHQSVVWAAKGGRRCGHRAEWANSNSLLQESSQCGRALCRFQRHGGRVTDGAGVQAAVQVELEALSSLTTTPHFSMCTWEIFFFIPDKKERYKDDKTLELRA